MRCHQGLLFVDVFRDEIAARNLTHNEMGSQLQWKMGQFLKKFAQP